MTGANHPQLILDGLCIFLNPVDFELGSAAIVKEDGVFHLLVIDYSDELTFAWESDDLADAKRVFIENHGERYLLQADEPKTKWSEWFTTKKEGSNEIYLDAVGLE